MIREICLNPDRAFKTFSFHCAGNTVWFHEIPVRVIRVGVTSAAAVKFRPAFPAVVLIVDMRSVEILEQMILEIPVLNISQPELFFTYKLMTRVNIPFR
jgi:hypothetical protein